MTHSGRLRGVDAFGDYAHRRNKVPDAGLAQASGQTPFFSYSAPRLGSGAQAVTSLFGVDSLEP
jgi:hypothetical protein